MTSATDPVLSVVVVIVSDTLETRTRANHLQGCLQALARQIDAPLTEVIVPYHANTEGIDALASEFAGVRFAVVNDPALATRTAGSREHHDVLRARGLALSRGSLVALLEDHARPDPLWSAAIVSVHAQDIAAAGGAIENGVDRLLNWAVYFCDFGRYENPLPAGESRIASDANTAYKRTALETVRPLWQRSFQEVIVNGALLGAGSKIVLSPAMVVYQHRVDLTLGDALRERFIWGRSYAQTRCTELSRPRRLVLAALSPILPMVLLLRMAGTARERRRHWGKFVRAAPLIALLTLVWSVGEFVGYLGVRGGRR